MVPGFQPSIQVLEGAHLEIGKPKAALSAGLMQTEPFRMHYLHATLVSNGDGNV